MIGECTICTCIHLDEGVTVGMCSTGDILLLEASCRSVTIVDCDGESAINIIKIGIDKLLCLTDLLGSCGLVS